MDWFKIGMIILLVVVASVLWTRSRVNIHIEPLENKISTQINPKDAGEKVNKLLTDAQDGLNIPSYHGEWQDLVLDWDKLAGFKMLELLKSTDNMTKTMTDFNMLADFKKNLNTALAVLDKS